MLLLSEENEGVADPRNEEHGRLKDPKFPLLHPSHLKWTEGVKKGRKHARAPCHRPGRQLFQRHTLLFLYYLTR